MNLKRKIALFAVISITCHIGCFISALSPTLIEVSTNAQDNTELQITQTEVEATVAGKGIFSENEVSIQPASPVIWTRTYSIDATPLIIAIIASTAIHIFACYRLIQR